eukprot:NODE_678_length_4811_cov_0.248302.p1 type:complete len:347 gc:universal NODE_678_length_4811_cov_0.248302:2929-3969(+)
MRLILLFLAFSTLRRRKVRQHPIPEIPISTTGKPRVYLFFDGTSNYQYRSKNGKKTGTDTNIYKMFNMLGSEEMQYDIGSLNKEGTPTYYKINKEKGFYAVYVSGVGVGPEGRVLPLKVLTGEGVDLRAEIGYKFLVDMFTNEGITPENMELSMFGFSRGATVTRMLATYLDLYGVSAENLGGKPLTKFEATFRNPKIPSVVGQKVKIDFMGLLDSVAAIKPLPGRNSKNLAKLSIEIPKCVVKVAHAVALHEYRREFNYDTIGSGEGKTETFFAGSHSDIGGFGGRDRGKLTENYLNELGNLVDINPTPSLGSVGDSDMSRMEKMRDELKKISLNSKLENSKMYG